MLIELRPAGENDAHMLWEMQVRCFEPLLEKYGDHSTNPACESEEMVKARLRQPFSDYYVIQANGEPAGGVRVVRRDGGRRRISPLFVVPELRRRGIAEAAMRQLEQLYPGGRWELNTILQEKGNCRLYEKLGFARTGEYEHMNEQMTLVYYAKESRSL